MKEKFSRSDMELCGLGFIVALLSIAGGVLASTGVIPFAPSIEKSVVYAIASAFIAVAVLGAASLGAYTYDKCKNPQIDNPVVIGADVAGKGSLKM